MHGIQYAFDIILPQWIFARRATLVWVSGGCLDVSLPLQNPLVDGSRDAMLNAISRFLLVCHPLGSLLNEWVEVVTEADIAHI